MTAAGSVTGAIQDPAPNLPAIIPGPIQRFADTGLQSQIDRYVNLISPGKHGAGVLYERNGTFGVAFVAKLGDQWSVIIGVDKPKGQKLSHEGVIRFEF